MKRLLVITFMLVMVILAGVLHGNYSRTETVKGLSITEVYMAQYPETVPTITFMPITTAPF